MNKSIVYLSEEIANVEHKFGESAKYYPVTVVTASSTGELIADNALFTGTQIKDAMRRANKQMNEIREVPFASVPAETSWWKFW